MFLHFHKLTTELFHSIKTQQISLFNASVGSNANCLCHVLGAIKSAGLQSATLSNRGLCVAGQWFLWLKQLTKSLGRRRYCTCLPAVRSLSSCLCTESGEVTYWLLLRLLWCCATCPSPGPVLWPVWSSRHPRWCWTASPGLCADRWSTCKGNRSLEIWAKTLLQSSGCCG